MCIEMLTGKRPWSLYTNHLALMFFVATSETVPAFPPNASDECIHFLDSCLKRDPEERKTATKLLLSEAFVNDGSKNNDVDESTGRDDFGIKN